MSNTARAGIEPYKQEYSRGLLTQRDLADILKVTKQRVSTLIAQLGWKNANDIARDVLVEICDALRVGQEHKSDKLYRYIRTCLLANANGNLSDAQMSDLKRVVTKMERLIITYNPESGWSYDDRFESDRGMVVRMYVPSDSAYYLLQIPSIQ